MTLYDRFGQLIGPAVVATLQWYSRVTGRPRARVIAINEYNEVLLVRCWAGTPFLELPGGGIERRESAMDAARRELYEETGIRATNLTSIGSVTIGYEAQLFLAMVRKDQLPAKRKNVWEIMEIGWSPVNDLPTNVSPLVIRALQKVSK